MQTEMLYMVCHLQEYAGKGKFDMLIRWTVTVLHTELPHCRILKPQPDHFGNFFLELFPFGKTKLKCLLEAGVLPVVKVGRDYLTNERELDRWFEANKGKEIFY